jgi:hypothetical protein
VELLQRVVSQHPNLPVEVLSLLLCTQETVQPHVAAQVMVNQCIDVVSNLHDTMNAGNIPVTTITLGAFLSFYFFKYLHSFILQTEIHLSNFCFFMPDFFFYVFLFGIVLHRSIAARHFCPHIDCSPPRGVKTQPPSNIGAILDSLAGEVYFF